MVSMMASPEEIVENLQADHAEVNRILQYCPEDALSLTMMI